MAVWMRIPVIVRAVLIGVAVAASATLPWSFIALLNIRNWAVVPWGVPLAAVLLWAWWSYVRGQGWPRSTAAARRVSLRANRVSEDLWGQAIVAGILGIATALLILRVLGRLVALPEQPIDEELTRLPALTLLLLSLMGSVVAGVAEEAALRGYMQRPIERRHGPVIAIAVTSTLFWLLHFNHQGFAQLMPFYVAIGVTYGTMAYLTDSILPGVVLHAGGDAMGSMMVLATGRQVSSQPIPVPTGGSGFDASFWLSVAGMTIVGAAAVWAFRALAESAREAPKPATV